MWWLSTQTDKLGPGVSSARQSCLDDLKIASLYVIVDPHDQVWPSCLTFSQPFSHEYTQSSQASGRALLVVSLKSSCSRLLRGSVHLDLIWSCMPISRPCTVTSQVCEHVQQYPTFWTVGRWWRLWTIRTLSPAGRIQASKDRHICGPHACFRGLHCKLSLLLLPFWLPCYILQKQLWCSVCPKTPNLVNAYERPNLDVLIYWAMFHTRLLAEVRSAVEITDCNIKKAFVLFMCLSCTTLVPVYLRLIRQQPCFELKTFQTWLRKADGNNICLRSQAWLRDS